MPNDFMVSASESQRYFHDLIKAPLGKILDTNRIELIEGVDHDIARQLDRTAGIDAWFHYGGSLIGLALRIQYDIFYETFTIRCHRESGVKIEYEKRRKAFQMKALAPLLTALAYVNRKENKLIGGAVARTEDLLTCIEQGKYRIRSTGGNQIGQASFYVINWSDVASLELPGRHSWCPTFGPNGE